MKKKIGILTFHNVPNYGAVLQAFALKTYLENVIDSEVNVIDFQCKGNSNEFIPNVYFNFICNSNNKIKKFIKKLLVKMFFEKKYIKKYLLFLDFAKDKFNLYHYDDKLYNHFNCIFCGSDQIWNGDITGGYQLPYFGADRSNDSTTTIAAYAASCGDINEFSDEKKKILFDLVKKADHVSVREKSLADELNKQNINALNVMDPTFLLSREEYVKALGIERHFEKKYILEYSLSKSDALDDVAAKISREKNIPIIKICGYACMKPEKGIFDAGPREFLSLVESAEYVVTNSFHGVALSIIFEKDFNVMLPSKRRARITDLLESIDLKSRICENLTDTDISSIDYREVGNKIKKYIDISKQYIKDVVSEENENE